MLALEGSPAEGTPGKVIALEAAWAPWVGTV